MTTIIQIKYINQMFEAESKSPSSVRNEFEIPSLWDADAIRPPETIVGKMSLKENKQSNNNMYMHKCNKKTDLV